MECQKSVASRVAGSCIGEAGLLPGDEPRMASCLALGEVTLLVLTRSQFAEIICKDDSSGLFAVKRMYAVKKFESQNLGASFLCYVIASDTSEQSFFLTGETSIGDMLVTLRDSPLGLKVV